MDDSDDIALLALELFENGENFSQSATCLSVHPKNNQIDDERDLKIISPKKFRSIPCLDQSIEQIRSRVADLPDEILQEIFASMPINDLLQTVNRACWQFNRIISDDRFLPYKKLYYQYRKKTEYAMNFVQNDVIKPNSKLLEPEESLAVIVWSKSVNEFRNVLSKERCQILDRLKILPNFKAVTHFLNTNLLSESFLNEPTVWNYIAGFIMLCEDSRSILSLLRLLTFAPRILFQHWIVDFFYCVLLYLAVVNDRIQIAHRLHYNLYYALYLFENSGSKFCSVESIGYSKNTNFLTSEQRRIVNFDLRPGDCVRVVAFAGTGKTTSLLEYIKNRPKQRFLIIFYNKSICEEAKKRFPANAECRTIHSIAYQSLNVQRVYKNDKLQANVYNSDITKAIPYMKVDGIPLLTVPALVKTTLFAFLASPDDHLNADHTPDTYFKSVRVVDEDLPLPTHTKQTIIITDVQKEALTKIAEELWCKMKDTTDKFPMTHDGYLKLFQLSRPNFKQLFPGVDVIMVDEAQDCNPTTLDIIMRQPHPKIVVGDDYQQIYGFRGSINALQRFPCSQTFYLTQSFRFGPDIAYFANCLLNKVKNENRKILVGTSNVCFIDGSVVGQTIVICRSNVQVFIECATLAKTTVNAKLYILGDQETLNFPLLKDLHLLTLTNASRSNQRTVTKQGQFLLKKFKSLTELEHHVEQTQEWHLRNMVKILKKFGMELPSVVERIKACLVTDISKADFIVSTVHKAKGMEFDNVRLSTDFADFTDVQNLFDIDNDEVRQNQAGPNGEVSDEYNLLYVAATRAKKSLIVNEQLMKVVTVMCKEGFQCLKIGRKLPDSVRHSGNLNCVVCNESIDFSLITDDELILYRKSVSISTDSNDVAVSKSGLQCRCCFFQPFVNLEEFLNLNTLKFYKNSVDNDGSVKKSLEIKNFRNISIQYAPFLNNFR